MPMNSGDDCISYQIDKDNRLTFVNEKWSVFAADNMAAHLTKTFVINKSIFAFISDKTSRHLYKMFVEQVRKDQVILRFPFRCDAPDRRRFMEMEMSPSINRAICFRSCILKEELREPVALLYAGVTRSNKLVKICSWCKKVELDHSEWAEVEDAVARLGLFNEDELPSLTHGMCPSCHEAYIHDLLKSKND
jgi:hypothetical protein